MKKVSFLLGILIIGTFTLFGQSDSVKVILNNWSLGDLSMVKTSDSCFLLFSVSTDSMIASQKGYKPGRYKPDFYILKVNNTGTLLWLKRLEDSLSYNHKTNIIKSENGNLYLTGLKEYKNGMGFLKLIKISPDGNGIIIDTAYLLSNNYESFIDYTIEEDKSGNLVLFYLVSDSIRKSNPENLYMRKFDKDGRQIFMKKIDYSFKRQGYLRSTIKNVNNSNHYYIIFSDFPQIRNLDSITGMINSQTDYESYEILSIDNSGYIQKKTYLTAQNKLHLCLFDDNSNYVGFSENSFWGYKPYKSFYDTISPDRIYSVDSSYLNMVIYDSLFQTRSETVIQNINLRFSPKHDYSITKEPLYVKKGADNSYFFLYKPYYIDSNYFHFVKTDLNGKILFDKEMRIDPFLYLSINLFATENGYTLFGAIRKISNQNAQNNKKFFVMLNMDLNGNVIKF